MNNKSANLQLTLEDLQLESFVTSIDSEMAQRIAGGLGSLEHPTHTQPTDTDDVPHAKCTTVVC